MRKLVCFGDSITARKEGFAVPMLTAKLTERLDSFQILNAGVSGDNTVNALSRIDQDVIKHQPDLVTVLFGTNDAAFHKMVGLDVFKDNLYQITKKITPQKTILISPSPIDEQVQLARTNESLSRYASCVRQVANETGSYFIDFFYEMIALPDYPKLLKGLRNDGLHFGENGYDFLADLIFNKIQVIYD